MAATKGLLYELSLNNKGFTDALAGARGAMSSFMGAIGKLGGLAGLAGGIVGAGSAALALKKSIDEAANMETMRAGFEVLLGNVEAAKQRMQELATFAAKTPFELPEVAAASRTLETMTKGVLATGKGLTLVGDLASGANQSFAEVAVTVGRLYDALQSGTAAGEPLQRLQEIGAIAGDTRKQIEQLQQAGAAGASVWAVAEQAVSRFGGSMERQGRTWNGLMSTLRDNLNAVFREFGTPLIDSLKPLLSNAIAMSDQLAARARQWGESLADGVRTAVHAFNKGELGKVVGMQLRVGFADAVAFLGTSLEEVFARFREIGEGLRSVFTGLADLLASAIREAIVGALKGVQIMGKPAIIPEMADAQEELAFQENRRGLRRLDAGVNKIMGESGAKTFKGLLSGLTTETDAARKSLAEMTASASSAAQATLESARQTMSGNFTKLFLDLLSEFTLKPNLPLQRAKETIGNGMMTDPLRRIGHFISPDFRSGNAIAERAVEANTKRTAEGVERLERRLGTKAAATF